MGKLEVEAFLGVLAVERNVSAATQTQALSALLFLYREVLGIELPWLDDLVRAKKPRRLPSVLTRAEVSALLGAIDDPDVVLPARLLYGGGLRLLECLRLRVKDVDVSRREILVPQMLEQIESARQRHVKDLAQGHGEVWLPDALAVKYPGAARAPGWQYFRRRASSKCCRRTRFAIHSSPICWSRAMTSVQSRSCWGMRPRGNRHLRAATSANQGFLEKHRKCEENDDPFSTGCPPRQRTRSR